MQDLVSVVIPVFNGEEFLDENIKCVMDQTYKKLEIIYICDGCTDNTINILQRYALSDSRIKIHVEKENKGAAVSRNIGMKMAKGEWIIFFDSDDLCAINMIEEMLKYALEKDADMVCCFWEAFSKKPIHIGDIQNENIKQYCSSYPVINVKDMEKNILQVTTYTLWTKLIYKSVYRKENVYFQDVPNCNDVYFSLVAAMESKRIVYIDQIFVFYRSNLGRKTLSTDRDWVRNYVWEAYDEVYHSICQRDNKKNLKQSFYNKVCECVNILSGGVLFTELFRNLCDIYFDKWGMQNIDAQEELSCYNQIIYNKIRKSDGLFDRGTLIMQAKELFVQNVARAGNCSIWGYGHEGKKLLEEMKDMHIGIKHIYDSAPSKWGIHAFGRRIEKYEGVLREDIIVTTVQYFEEIKEQIGDRARNVYNLDKEIFLY